MEENLIKLLSDQMTPGVLGKLSGVLGESEEATGKAVNAAIPGIMGAMMKQGATESGAQGLMGMMDKLPAGLDLSDVSGLLANQNQSKSLLDSGSGLVSGLLGGGGGGNKMFDLISSVSGIGRAKSGNLMGLLTPIAMGMLRGKMRNNGLGAAGLASMLLGQRNFLKAAAPNGLTDALGLASFDDIGANLGNAANVNVGLGNTGLGNAANNVSGAVGGAVQGGVDNVRGAAGNVAGGVRDAAGNITGGVRDAAGNVAGNVGDGVRGTAGAVGGAVAGGAAATAAVGGKVARGGMGIGRWLLPLLGLILLGLLLWWLFTNFLGGNRGADVNLPGGNAAANVTSSVGNAAGNAAGAVSGAVSGAVDATGNAVGAVGDAAGNAAGAVGNAAGNAASAVTGAASGAANSAAGAVSGAAAAAIPANVLSGVCGSVSGLTSSLGAFPALGADTDTTAVVDGVNAIRSPIEGILTAAGTVGIPGLNALTEGFNGLRGVVDGISGATLGASAGAVSSAFDGLKGANDTFTNSLNCNN